MNTMNMPGFNAAASLSANKSYYRHQANNYQSIKDEVIFPAFRVNCDYPWLGLMCTVIGGTYSFPCWWNSGCMFAHAVATFPPCATCSFVD